MISVFFVTYVFLFRRIEAEVADGSYEAVNSERDARKEEISQRSASITFRFKICVVDD